MKRALVALAVLGLFSLAGLAQLSGTTCLFAWTTDITDLTKFKLFADLDLKYKFGDWTISTYDYATQAGLVYASFGISGTVGPLSVSGTLRFNPSKTDPADIVIRNDFKISLSFAGLDTGLWVFHDVVPPSGTFTLLPHRFGLRNVYCDDAWSIVVTNAETQTSGVMVYYTWVKAEGFRMDIFFTDPSTGIELDTVMAEMMIPLCCGISAETEVKFTKAIGLDWVKFKLKDLSLCCGFTFDAEILYGITSKTITVKPKYKGLDGCIVLYGGWDFSETQFTGIGLHGLALKCAFGDCPAIGFLTAWAPSYFFVPWELFGYNLAAMASKFIYRYYDANQPLPNWWSAYYDALFKTGEIEVIWVKGCGTGCCGGQYTYELDVFMGKTGFFGFKRARGFVSIPITSQISVNALLELTTTGVTFLGGGFCLSF